MITLRHATVEWTDYGCFTRFHSGPEVGAFPHPGDTQYHIIADRCGYGFDLLAYAREHDLLHSLVSEWLFDKPSPVLMGVATGNELTGPESAYEECFVQAMQCYLRKNERPILSGLDRLTEWRDQALYLIAAEAALCR